MIAEFNMFKKDELFSMIATGEQHLCVFAYDMYVFIEHFGMDVRQR